MDYRSDIAEFIRCATPEALQSFFAASRERGATDRTHLRWAYFRFYFYILGRQTGSASLHVSHDDELVLWRTFYPNQSHGVTRRGAGTLAHTETLVKVVEQEGLPVSYRIVHTSANPGRRAQLDKMRLVDGEHLESYMRKSIDYANSKGFRFREPVYKA